MLQEDLELFQIGQIMRRFKATRRIINHAVETLCLEPCKWRGGARLFDEDQVNEIGKKLERNSQGRGSNASVISNTRRTLSTCSNKNMHKV